MCTKLSDNVIVLCHLHAADFLRMLLSINGGQMELPPEGIDIELPTLLVVERRGEAGILRGPSDEESKQMSEILQSRAAMMEKQAKSVLGIVERDN